MGDNVHRPANRGTLPGVSSPEAPDTRITPRTATPPVSYATTVQDIVRNQLGEAPLRVRHNAFGHRNLTYTAQLRAQAVIVRLNPSAAAFASTVKNIEVLRQLSIPAPDVLAADLSCSRYPVAYMILRAIPGTDLRFALPTMSQRQQELVARQVMGFERLVASLSEGRGYGYAGIGESAPHRTWRDVIAFGNFSQTYSPRVADRALVKSVEKALDGIAAYLEGVPPTCFLDDLTTKNVIVDKGVLQGVVDFDVVCYGDPLFQVGLTQAAVGFDLPAASMTYVDHLCAAADVTLEQRRVVDLYAALCGVDFLGRTPNRVEHGAGARLVKSWLDRAS